MKTRTLPAGLIAAMLVAGNAVAQTKPSVQTAANNASLASGTTLVAELSASIDSKKAKVGDPVIAHVTDAAKAGGETVIPKGAKLVGHVTQAAARGKGDSDSALGIQFDKAVLKNGQEIPLSVWIRAIAAEPRSVYQPGPEQSTLAGTPGAGPSPMGSSRSTTGGPPAAAAPPMGASTDTGSVGSVHGGEPTSAAAGGLNAMGQLSSNSRGVFGLDGVHLATDASNSAQGSLITSSGKSVRLDSGTRLLLVVLSETSATPSKQLTNQPSQPGAWVTF
jgi:hypothetical protein